MKINDETIPIKINNINSNYSYEIDMIYEFYWNFSNVGIHNIKILFKKKLNNCKYLFHNCTNIYI